jgi:hypothetical protein
MQQMFRSGVLLVDWVKLVIGWVVAGVVAVLAYVRAMITGTRPHRHPDLERAIEAARRAAYRQRASAEAGDARVTVDQGQGPDTSQGTPWPWPYSQDPELTRIVFGEGESGARPQQE